MTREQDRTLLKLRTADVPQKVKDRAEIIRLNAHGWYVEKIAAHFNLGVAESKYESCDACGVLVAIGSRNAGATRPQRHGTVLEIMYY